MLHQYSLRTLASKPLLECLTFYNVPLANTTRAFSSNADVAHYFKENILNKRRILEKKRDKDDNKVVKAHLEIRSNLIYLWTMHDAPNQYSFSLLNIAHWWKYKGTLYKRHDQKFHKHRHEILGYDLAAAHFLVRRQGRVKFRGNPKWIEQKDYQTGLPKVYDAQYIVMEIDIHKMDLIAEGVENFLGLVHLEWLSLKGCDAIDDWVLDKISAEYPALKYLDISDCKNVTERGLEALYRMQSLEKLIVTNHGKSVAFELTCLMLEDVLPNLRCEILVPSEEETNV